MASTSTSTRGEAHPSPTRETQTTNDSTKTKSMFSIPSLLAKFCVSKSETPENHHQNAASISPTTKKNDSSGEDPPLPSEVIPDHEDPPLPSEVIPDQEALSASFEMITDDLRHMDAGLKKYTAHMEMQINMARKKLEELQNSRSSKRDLEVLTKSIDKLKLQTHTPVSILPATKEDERHGGLDLPPLSKMLHNDITFVDSALLETKEHINHMILEVNRAYDNFKKLPHVPTSRERVSDVPDDFDRLWKTVKTLKDQIRSYTKIRPLTASIRHPYKWPDINGMMMEISYEEPTPVASTCDSKGLLKAFQKLPMPMFRICLLCFFKFPPGAIIKRTTMIYVWIGLGYVDFLHGRDTKEVYGNRIFDLLVARGFVQPIDQNCSLVPNSCTMSPSVRSALYEVAKYHGFTSHNKPLSDRGHFSGYLLGYSCLVNVGEAAICSKPESRVKNVDYIRVLHYGRWQNSALGYELADAEGPPTHHIELDDAQILHDLKNLKNLTFLSLQGISMILELPPSLSELQILEILDLRACHDLKAIPDNISLLQRLTHLDMSECYLLEYMPESLAQLSNLEVLKGFLVGGLSENKQLCTLSKLSGLRKLKKLNIYISVKVIDTALWEFDYLKNLKVLEKLTISWGGCSLLGESHRQREAKTSADQRSQPPWTLPPKLHKLNLQCFPTNCLIDFFLPAGVKELKKLYIRGGHLRDLDLQTEDQGEQWNVEILRLKYLRELDIDWSNLKKLFPLLVYLHQVECPKLKLRNFPCNERGVWMKENTNNTHVQLDTSEPMP